MIKDEEKNKATKQKVYVLNENDVIESKSLSYLKNRIFKASIEIYTGTKIDDKDFKQFMAYINGIEKPNKSPNDINLRIAKIHKYIIIQYDNYNYVSSLVKKINS